MFELTALGGADDDDDVVVRFALPRPSLRFGSLTFICLAWRLVVVVVVVVGCSALALLVVCLCGCACEGRKKRHQRRPSKQGGGTNRQTGSREDVHTQNGYLDVSSCNMCSLFYFFPSCFLSNPIVFREFS